MYLDPWGEASGKMGTFLAQHELQSGVQLQGREPVLSVHMWGSPKIRGTLPGVPNNKLESYNILGSILGSAYLRKLPYTSRKDPRP